MAKSISNPEKKKAWNAFSKYIRTRDCIATTGTAVAGRCITCGKSFHFRVLHAGHFIAGRGNAILFNRKFVNIQCYHCNIFHNGRFDIYRAAMVHRYGKAFVDRWEIKLKGMAKRGAITSKQINWEQRTKRYLRLTKILERGVE